MLGFILGDMYSRTSGFRPPPRLGKHFPLAPTINCVVAPAQPS